MGITKGITMVVKEITPMGPDYSHTVRVVLWAMNGFEAGKSFGFWARHMNRLSDTVVRLNDGNPTHTIEVG